MTYYPLIVILFFAVLDWIAVEKKWSVLEYVSKTATILAIIAWIWLSVGFGGAMVWFTLGLFFCLAGDIFFMLPGDKLILGLLAFLVGQIFYVIGFNNLPPYINVGGGIVMIILAIYVAWIYPQLRTGLKAKGKNNLQIPVLIYSLVITIMVYSALMTWTRPGWPTISALSVSLGAIFFYISDTFLAWIRFVKPINHGRTMNMITYHLGQIGIILGAMLHIALT